MNRRDDDISFIHVIVACSGLFGASRIPSDRDDTTIVEVPDGKSNILLIENFLRIKEFILAQGRRQTYCNMFNDNPYYPFANFNLYLNPPDQRNINCDPRRSDFPVIVIQTTSGSTEYWDIRMDERSNKLVILQNYSFIRPDALMKTVEGFFREALVAIEKQGSVR